MKLYQVIVGNIGLVCNTCIRDVAIHTFKYYTQLSIDEGHRATGEDVTLFTDGEVEEEWIGGLTRCPRLDGRLVYTMNQYIRLGFDISFAAELANAG